MRLCIARQRKNCSQRVQTGLFFAGTPRFYKAIPTSYRRDLMRRAWVKMSLQRGWRRAWPRMRFFW